VGRDDEVRDGEIDDGVAEELESLVGLAVVFGRVTRVRQGDEEYLARSRESNSLG
jgi:predicted O-linked N-acetylglucosamine transferase (SPINDLY family)